jgi:ParB-like chromosome segregation protein Spo0J
VKVETVAISALQKDPENARTHNANNIKAIAKSLERFGQRKPIVVWQGFVIAGNGTLEAAQSLGWSDIEVARVPEDWTHEEARAYALVDNRSGELASWDPNLLANQLLELDAVGWNTADLGFAQFNPAGSELKDTSTEINVDEWKFDHKCPKCGFEFNDVKQKV